MMVGGTSRASGPSDTRPWTFYALAFAVRRVPAVPLRADAGDLRAVVPGTEWRRDVPDGRRLALLVPRRVQARDDGEHPCVVHPLDRACRGGERAHRGVLGRRRARLSAGDSRAPACVFYFAVASLVMPSLLVGFGIGFGFQVLGLADQPVHLGARRAAHLDAAVRPVCHVRRGEPLQPRLRGSGERPRRHGLAAAAPCHAADPAARHHRRGDGRLHALL